MDRKKSSAGRLARWSLLVIMTAVLIWRAPNLLVAPRLWAEEGLAYFPHSFEHGFLESLVFVWWLSGYIHVTLNLATAIGAHWLPLELAPFATTYVALAIQIVPILIVLFGHSSVLEGTVRKAAACLIFLCAPMVTGEVWLNTLNAQIFFGLIAILILLEDVEEATARRLWAYRALLALGGLSGIYVVFVQPAFAFRAFFRCKREHFVHLAIVTAALVFQAALTLRSLLTRGMNPRRTINLGWLSVSDFSIHHIGLPVLGNEIVLRVIVFLKPFGDYVFLALFLIALPIMLYDKGNRRIEWRDSRMILVVALLALAGATALTALHGRSTGRYAILSGYVVLLFILINIRPIQRPVLSSVLILLLCISLTSGLLRYRTSRFLRCDGSTWKLEIDRWRQDPDHPIQICPKNWEMKLSPPNARKRKGMDGTKAPSLQSQLDCGEANACESPA